MSHDNILQLFALCSRNSQKNIKQFLSTLFAQEEKPEPSTNDSLVLQTLFHNITKEFSIAKSRQASKNQRHSKFLEGYQYNYGEINFQSLYSAMRKIQSKDLIKQGQDIIFYDLGSGSGKVLFAASLCFPLLKCIGIQVLQSLYACSLRLQQKIQKNRHDIQNVLSQEYGIDFVLPTYQTINKKLEDYNWSDGNIVFVSSTCYSQQLMESIRKMSSNMKAGSIFITLTKKLDQSEKSWKVLDKFQGETTWGNCTIFIQRKLQ